MFLNNFNGAPSMQFVLVFSEKEGNWREIFKANAVSFIFDLAN